MSSTAATYTDPLAEVLRNVSMSGIFYCPSELTEPWGIYLPPMPDCMWFHAVLRGSCTFEADGDPSTRKTIAAGDIVVVPGGTGHRGWGAEQAPTPSVFDLPHDEFSEHYALLRHGGGGALTHLVCGGISFDHPAARQLVAALPTVIHIDGSQSTRADAMRATIDLMADELQLMQPGSEAVISRLCDIVVVQAIRTWIERDSASATGWLGALRDPQIGAALVAIHADPARPWSVELLAESVAMSRSGFAARFTQQVGEPAMRYVTRWRMHVALDLLRAGDSTVASAARAVGYESEAAFSRAFTRVIGMSPAAAGKAG